VFALILTVAASFGLIIVADEAGTDSVAFVITTVLMGFGFGLFVGNSLEHHLPRVLWNHLSLSRDASRKWGVHIFNGALSRIGWNKLIFAMREGSSVESTKSWDPRHMRAAAGGHGWAIVLHSTSSVWAVATGGWISSVILIVVGVFGHLYPVLLQIRVLTTLKEAERRL